MTDQPTPETDAKLADDPQPSSDSPDYARALEIHIHLLRAELADVRAKKSDAFIAAVDDLERLTAERDAAISLGRHALFCVHHTDAERIANTVGGNCPICNKAQIQQLRAERDALRAALDEYGEHQGVCPKKYHGMKDSRPCTCGLDAALATSAQ